MQKKPKNKKRKEQRSDTGDSERVRANLFCYSFS